MYLQGRHIERLTNEEYAREVPEQTRKEWVKNIIVKAWGKDLLIEAGVADNKEEAQSLTAEDIREMMDRVSAYATLSPSPQY